MANTEERRAYKKLIEEGYKIQELEFRLWCDKKRARYGSLWNQIMADRIVEEWKIGE